MTMTDGMIDLSALRKCAAEWHGGQASPLYALASSGAIVEGLADEIRENIDTAEQFGKTDPDYAADVPKLRHLLVYVTNCGERGPVDGWSEIRF